MTTTAVTEREPLVGDTHISKTKWFILSILSVLLGIVQTSPMAILVPESISKGLSDFQATIILVAWPFSSLIALIIQPLITQLDRRYIAQRVIACTGCAAFCLFYPGEMYPKLFIWCAVTSRLLAGCSLFLLKNDVVVIITEVLAGNVAKAASTWEVCYSTGQAIGAYTGAIIALNIGFTNTMILAGLAFFVIGFAVQLLWDKTSNREVIKKTTTREVYRLHFTPPLLVFGWSVNMTIGGCMVFVYGMLSYYYSEEYGVSLDSTSLVLGMGSVVYSIAAFLVGVVNSKGERMTLPGLVVGLIGAAISLVFLGPSIPLKKGFPISVISFNTLLVFSALIQLNSITISAQSLTTITTTELAMSITMNVACVSYNVGAIIDPLLAAWFTDYLPERQVFALGTPVFVALAVTVVLAFYMSGRGNYGNIEQQDDDDDEKQS
eukprot:sb/3464832/